MRQCSTVRVHWSGHQWCMNEHRRGSYGIKGCRRRSPEKWQVGYVDQACWVMDTGVALKCYHFSFYKQNQNVICGYNALSFKDHSLGSLAISDYVDTKLNNVILVKFLEIHISATLARLLLKFQTIFFLKGVRQKAWNHYFMGKEPSSDMS